jgi:hypothetical protein
MRRVFGLPAAILASIAGVFAAVGIPSINSGAAVASAASSAQQIGMKILVITDSSNANAAIAYGDWVNTLQREGVPYASLVTSSSHPGAVQLPALSSTLGDGTQVANYQGVVVAVSGLMGLTNTQWDQLQTFEHRFSVRQVTAYAVPSGDYGLSGPTPAGGAALPLSTSLTLTADGAKVFPYLNRLAVDPTQSTWAYEATPASGQNVDTLISGPGGSSLLGIYTSPDGRETMYQTFNENQYYLQSELLRHGELAWLTRNTYFGDQRNYIEMDIDDTFTPDDAWDTATHQIDYNDADALRMQPGDVDYAAQWSAKNHFRMDQLFNGGGSVAYQADNGGTDPLLAEFQKNDPATNKPYADDFGWISHTYDTPYMDVGCATQNYIEAELNENTSWAAGRGSGGTGGLSLTQTTDPNVSLGAEDGQVFVPGNHSGFANLVPGNPATVDPPTLDSTSPTPAADATSTLPAGTYEYAVTDQFTNSPTAGQSAADVTSPVVVTAGESVTLQWQAICHAADYIIYRGIEGTGGTYTWSQIGTVSTPFSATLPDNSSADTTGGSKTNVAGGGEIEQTFTDAGAAGTTTTEPSTSAENAVETPWEENPYFAPALKEVGITAVGDDGSKPYPTTYDEFGIGVPITVTGTGSSTTCSPVTCYPPDSTFVLPGTSAHVVPRHPVNVYYNASTDAMELDEYQTLYPAGSGPCPTTCNFRNVVTQVVGQMFQYMMNNDPRPSYVHQTNIMGAPPSGSEESPDLLPPSTYTPPATCTAGAACTKGDGTLYQVLDPLLYQYNEYFNSSAPFVQLTEQAIANLLAEQSAWSATTGVTGSIEGNVVTLNNTTGSSIEIPLTGITSVGSDYEGSRSGWTDAPTGISRYTALTAWPAPPTGPPIPKPPKGRAPGGPPAGTRTTLLAYVAVQTTPKTVGIKHGKVTVSLKCQATKGKTAKGKICSGRFTLTVSGRKVAHSFRFKSGKVDHVSVTLPAAVRKAITARRRRHKHPKLKGKLVIVTTLTKRTSYTARGTLTIKT